MRNLNRIITIITTLLLCIATNAQVSIDGRERYYDRATDSYLVSVPETWFDDGSVAELTATNERTQFTFLPMVRLQGTFGYEYTPATVSVVMPDGTSSQLDMNAKVKWRGGTTNAEDKHKRNYSVKFLDANGAKQDRKFFGLRKDNHWILDAGQADFSRIRNRVATDLWNDFATKPYYYDREPKALTGTRGQFVEVFLNDEYVGIYCMTENMDRSQLKLKKYTDNADGSQTIHGQLWKSKGFRYTAFGEYGDYDNSSETWGSFETKYPELEDVSPTDYSLIYDAVVFCTDVTDEEFTAHVAEYFDIPAMLDYVLFLRVLQAIDNQGKNVFWACYDRTTDKRLTPAVWDLDATTGQSWTPLMYHDKAVSPDSIYEFGYWHFIRIDSLNAGGFHDRMIERYWELRQDYFDPDTLTARYHNYMNMLTKCGAYARETKRWSGDSDLAGRELDFAAEAEYISKWIHRRIEVMDEYSIPQSDGIRDVVHAPSIRNSATFTLQGVRVGAGYKGIVISNGKKILVR